MKRRDTLILSKQILLIITKADPLNTKIKFKYFEASMNFHKGINRRHSSFYQIIKTVLISFSYSALGIPFFNPL